MWLVEIDNYTGYIDDNEEALDGWNGISEFRRIVEKYGLPGMTVIAYYCDYLSPFRNYVDSERWLKSQDEVFGNQNEMDINEEVISEAILKYGALQFNVDMERAKLNSDIERELISKLRQAYLKEDEALIDKINKQLKSHSDSVKEFKKTFDLQGLINERSVTKNGYKLSRIELDMELRRHSKFKGTGEKIKNPNKLGISESVEDSQ